MTNMISAKKAHLQASADAFMAYIVLFSVFFVLAMINRDLTLNDPIVTSAFVGGIVLAFMTGAIRAMKAYELA